MSSTSFQSLLLALEHIAEPESRASADERSPLSATMGGLTVVYALNDAERIVTVVNIFRAGSGRVP